MTTTPTTTSPPAVRVILTLTGPGLFSMRVESCRSTWDGEFDMTREQLLAIAGLAGTALYHEHTGICPPGWTRVCPPLEVLLPPELAPADADRLDQEIWESIAAGFDAAAGRQ
ncbi:hypothetical protein [Cupriavidus oxalaticus]|uniref:Uncharacterized protein n=1 Tax=Cupriavidus oxalaticus TaxID=96344 RepID=A0A4P7LAI7_9BURK|nr:hypothetical protein [Cupriavidus oxalaticus]QBY52528.1 hypothetical protein E0W60_15165 [Cupriavidus oxalaticus]